MVSVILRCCITYYDNVVSNSIRWSGDYERLIKQVPTGEEVRPQSQSGRVDQQKKSLYCPCRELNELLRLLIIKILYKISKTGY